jgi:hypothetical protein
MKFDPDAVAFPYPFVGTVARGNKTVLEATVDVVVADPGNVTEAEAMTYWALNSKAFKALKSHSATDISEAAFKVHCGEISRLRSKLDAEVWQKWLDVGHSADDDDIKKELQAIEVVHGEREIRRTRLQFALFLEGLKQDKPGTVRTALLYRSNLMAQRCSKHFVDTGMTISGDVTDAEAVAKKATDTKTTPLKRARYTVTTHKDQMCVRNALMIQTLQTAGIPLTDDVLERNFIKDGPNAVSAMMSELQTVVDHKRRKLTIPDLDTKEMSQ